MPRSLIVVWTIFVKDLRVEWRYKEAITSVSVFGLLVVFLFNFAFESSREESLRLLPGLLWVAFAFAGVMSFNRSFSSERENAALEGLTLAPIDQGLIYVAKVGSNVFFLIIAECVVMLAAALWYNLSVAPSLGRLCGIVLLGTLGYAAVGVTFGAVAANTRMREVMLPLLQFPVALPVFIAAIEATSGALRGEPPAQYASWVRLLAGFCVIFLVLSFLLFEYVLEE